MITLLCVVTSATLLGLGLATDTISLSYAAGGVALIGIAIWIFTLVRTRRAADSDGPGEAVAEPNEATKPADGKEAGEVGEDTTAEESPSTESEAGHVMSQKEDSQEAEQADDDVVIVVPGRKRFHHADCTNLNGHTREELTLDEARDEGFSACTTCASQV